jgi:hypothetical protein
VTISNDLMRLNWTFVELKDGLDGSQWFKVARALAEIEQQRECLMVAAEALAPKQEKIPSMFQSEQQ